MILSKLKDINAINPLYSESAEISGSKNKKIYPYKTARNQYLLTHLVSSFSPVSPKTGFILVLENIFVC